MSRDLPSAPAPEPPRRTILLAAALLLAALVAAYANSLHGPFTYDDKPAIALNPSIRQLWPLGDVLHPPASAVTVSGRPVLNLSFALNFAISGTRVRGYHLTNIALHALATLALFGLVRRVFLLPVLRPRFGAAALPLAFACALLWGLHPLQTESVTYVVQRAESLMGLFYLVTLYCFVRAATAPAARVWPVLAFLACALGMATKENMASAPVIALLLDRTFLSGSFVAAWHRSRRLYLALALTWIPLAWLILGTGANRDGSMGFGLSVPWWNYALTQFPALTRYLALALFPQPLVFDYGTFLIDRLASVAVPAAVVTALIVTTAIAFFRRPVLGFVGVFCLAILAPTSLVPATVQMIVEHRMYLPLAALIPAIVASVYLSCGLKRTLLACTALAGALGLLTAQRNATYRDEITLWSDTVAKRPGNAIALTSLGSAYADAHRREEAIRAHEAALALVPNFPSALADLGNVYIESGRVTEALPLLEKAVRLAPDNVSANLNLGVALDLLGRPEESLRYFREAVRLCPVLEAAHNNLGAALCRAGQREAGIAHLEQALRLNPDSAEAHFNLGGSLAALGRFADASAHFSAGFRLRPDDFSARTKWAGILFTAGRQQEAITQHEAVVRDQPGYVEGRYNFGTTLASLGRYDEALRELEAAVRLKPSYAEAHNNLGNVLLSLSRPADAVPHYEEALRLKPANPAAHDNLGLALAQLGRTAEALPHFEEAVRQAPNFSAALDHRNAARAELGQPARAGSP